MNVYRCNECNALLPYGEFGQAEGRNGSKYVAPICKRCKLKIRLFSLEQEIYTIKQSIKGIDQRREKYQQAIRADRDRQKAMKID